MQKKIHEAIAEINERIKNGEEISNIESKDIHGDPIDIYLKFRNMYDHWNISTQEWVDLVREQADAKDETLPIIEGVTVGKYENNELKIPGGKRDPWVLYKNDLKINKNFSDKAIENIEKDTYSILRRISADTQQRDPIKGLVVGSVQSGKTTSMAALMAMASSYSWNVFIVMSGVIDNLRVQTEQRLFEDMRATGNAFNWELIDNPSLNSPYHQKSQSLDFSAGSNKKYLIVTLKVKSRLHDLIKWITKDQNQMKNMRILLIDDEADQASVNTVDLNVEERKAINDAIVNLVNSRSVQGKKLTTKFGAMNYLAYTATPYANILSESPSEALYPQDFISLLSPSNEHFGPTQIFGVDESNLSGLDIVRSVNKLDIETLSSVENGTSTLPQSLKNSIAYFISASASLRSQRYKKPISMLIHSSIKVEHHNNLSKAVVRWLSDNRREVLKTCERVWNLERDRFTKQDFLSQFQDYPSDLSESYQLLEFHSIEDEIKNILKCIAPVKMDDDKQIKYHNGVQICVDNSYNNKMDSENNYYRLIYPEDKELEAMDKAPIFLIIGGATLSRGLTINGLITTHFTRNTSTADSLMQMGRWFGYRKKIELYPRIWLTDKLLSQFKFLSTLDTELREELTSLAKQDVDYAKIGPKIKNTPRNTYLKLTSKNKMRAMIEVNYNFAGQNIQTYKFSSDEKIMKENIARTEKFLNSLGKPLENDDYPGKSYYWKGVSVKKIGGFLKEYSFVDKTRTFRDIDAFVEWAEEATNKNQIERWNVIMANIEGKKSKSNKGKTDDTWKLDHFEVNKVTRNKKRNSEEGIIDIGVLRNFNDLFRDIDLNKVDIVTRALIKENQSKNYNEIRKRAGYPKTPQLIFYCIDKNSSNKGIGAKVPLGVQTDIIGMVISIPGDNDTSSTDVTVKNMEINNMFSDEESDDNL